MYRRQPSDNVVEALLHDPGLYEGARKEGG